MIPRSHFSPLLAQPFIQGRVWPRLTLLTSLLGRLAVYACGTPTGPVTTIRLAREALESLDAPEATEK